jgi:hypothetical protein
MTLQTIDLPALSVRAAVRSVDESARTVELIFSTGAPVDRIDWAGKRYTEVLSMTPGHVRLDRLNSGAPLLNAHSAYSIADVIGTVEQNSARVANGLGLATVRFSRRDDVEPIFQDVVDGIIRAVSVGYRVHKFQEEASKDGALTRTAIDWEPFELSMVPMPADPGARVRAGAGETNVCELVPRNDEDFNSPEADFVRTCRFAFLKAGVPFPADLFSRTVFSKYIF